MQADQAGAAVVGAVTLADPQGWGGGAHAGGHARPAQAGVGPGARPTGDRVATLIGGGAAGPPTRAGGGGRRAAARPGPPSAATGHAGAGAGLAGPTPRPTHRIRLRADS